MDTNHPWAGAQSMLPAVDTDPRVSTDGCEEHCLPGKGCGWLCHKEGHEEDIVPGGVVRPMVLLLWTITVCTFADWAISKIPRRIRPPVTCVIYMLGILMSWASMHPRDVNNPRVDVQEVQRHDVWGGIILDSINSVEKLDPHVIFFLFLPALLYEDASGLNYHVFAKVAKSSILLAVPGVILNTLFVGGFIWWFFDDNYSFFPSMLLAAILSATDPVAVINALKGLGAPKKLSTLIAGEALLNDGSGVVVFHLFLDAVTVPNPESHCTLPWDVWCPLGYFIRLSFGGCAYGLFFGFLLFRITKYFTDPMTEVVLLLSFMYGVFISAELWLTVSGVLASVCSGLFYSAIGFSALTQQGQHILHQGLGLISYMSNQAIFLFTGIVSFRWSFIISEDLHDDGRVWLNLFLLYIVLHVARIIMVGMFWPLLVRWGYGLTFKEAIVLVYGGLRGAVSLALGLLIKSNPYILKLDEEKGMWVHDEELQESIAFYVSGIVFLTLLINGWSVTYMYELLQVYPSNPFHTLFVAKSMHRLELEYSRIVNSFQKHFFFSDISFDCILPAIPDYRKVKFDQRGVPLPEEKQKTLSQCIQDLEEKFWQSKIETPPDDIFAARNMILRRHRVRNMIQGGVSNLYQSNALGSGAINLHSSSLNRIPSSLYTVSVEDEKTNLSPVNSQIFSPKSPKSPEYARKKFNQSPERDLSNSPPQAVGLNEAETKTGDQSELSPDQNKNTKSKNQKSLKRSQTLGSSMSTPAPKHSEQTQSQENIFNLQPHQTDSFQTRENNELETWKNDLQTWKVAPDVNLAQSGVVLFPSALSVAEMSSQEISFSVKQQNWHTIVGVFCDDSKVTPGSVPGLQQNSIGFVVGQKRSLKTMPQLWCGPNQNVRSKIVLTFLNNYSDMNTSSSNSHDCGNQSCITMRIHENSKNGKILEEHKLGNSNQLHAFVAFYQPPELRRAQSLDLLPVHNFETISAEREEVVDDVGDEVEVNFPPVCSNEVMEYNEAYLSLFHALRAHYDHAYEHDEIGDKIFLEMNECLDQAIDSANLELNSGYLKNGKVHGLVPSQSRWAPEFVIKHFALAGRVSLKATEINDITASKSLTTLMITRQVGPGKMYNFHDALKFKSYEEKPSMEELEVNPYYRASLPERPDIDEELGLRVDEFYYPVVCADTKVKDFMDY